MARYLKITTNNDEEVNKLIAQLKELTETTVEEADDFLGHFLQEESEFRINDFLDKKFNIMGTHALTNYSEDEIEVLKAHRAELTTALYNELDNDSNIIDNDVIFDCAVYAINKYVEDNNIQFKDKEAC